MKDYYEVLVVPKDASGEQIDAAYKALAETVGRADEDLKDINEAYAVLSDPSKRTRYDQQLKVPAKSDGKAVRTVSAVPSKASASSTKKTLSLAGLTPNSRVLLAVVIGVVLLAAVVVVVLLTRQTGSTTSVAQSSDNVSLITTASGLKYADLVIGTGKTPAPADWVTLHYTGTLADGSIFDASRAHGEPLTGPLDALVKEVPGWGEGISTMKVGGTRRMVIPPSLAFGDQGAGNVIPPNATITLTVDLLDTRPAPQVKIEDTVVGTGVAATTGVTVSVNYTGKLQDGTVFDTSIGKQPFEFQLGAGQVIPGWDQGLIGLKVGGKRTLTIPPELAYRAQGAGNGLIPPNATLTFDVELLAIK
jgi:peptidylprolyl isomerase